MRTRQAIINGISGFMINIPIILLGLVYQKIFIGKLGAEYLGVSGLFTNIISMLSIAELGIGTAIVFHLYQPIVDKDTRRISELINYYRRSYYIVMLIIISFGLVLLPIIPMLVGSVNIKENIYIIYILFLLDCVSSYCFVYRQSVLIADQKNYIVNLGLMLYKSITYMGQMIYLQFSTDYYMFLIIGIIIRISDNLILTRIANKRYPYIKLSKECVLNDQDILKDISRKIKATIFHSIGGFIVIGSDNILISLLCGINAVGLYSNYNMIISAVKSIITQTFQAVTSGVGNLLVTTDKNHQFIIYKKMHYLNYITSSMVALCIWTLMDSWIKVWIGEKWLLSQGALLALVVNLYLMLMRNTLSIFKSAAGIVYEDRFIPIIESLINLICSIVLFKKLGFSGIFWGTVCSNLVLHLFSYPYYVYHRIFNGLYIKYYLEFLSDIVIFAGNLVLLVFLKKYFSYLNFTFITEMVMTVMVIGVVLLMESLMFYQKEILYYIRSIKKYKGRS